MKNNRADVTPKWVHRAFTSLDIFISFLSESPVKNWFLAKLQKSNHVLFWHSWALWLSYVSTYITMSNKTKRCYVYKNSLQYFITSPDPVPSGCGQCKLKSLFSRVLAFFINPTPQIYNCVMHVEKDGRRKRIELFLPTENRGVGKVEIFLT